MSAASPLSTSDQLIAPAFFTMAPNAGLFIRSVQHWVRPQRGPKVPALSRRSSQVCPERVQACPPELAGAVGAKAGYDLCHMNRGVMAGTAGAILLAGAVFAWNAIRQER